MNCKLLSRLIHTKATRKRNKSGNEYVQQAKHNIQEHEQQK